MTIKMKEAMQALLRLFALLCSYMVPHAISCCVHLSYSFAYGMMVIIEKISGETFSSRFELHDQRQKNIKNVKYVEPANAGIVDMDATLSVDNSVRNVKHSPEILIANTHQLLNPKVELGCKSPDLLAEDFQAVFPFVGPVDKNTFWSSMREFTGEELPSSPSPQRNYYGFTVDPTELNRVWYLARSTLAGADSVHVFSMSFDDQGRCYKFTADYPIGGTSENVNCWGRLSSILRYAIPGRFPFPREFPWIPSVESCSPEKVLQIKTEWNNLLAAFRD